MNDQEAREPTDEDIARLLADGASQRAVAVKLGVTRARVRAVGAPNTLTSDQRVDRLERALAQMAIVGVSLHGTGFWNGRASLRAIFEEYQTGSRRRGTSFW